MFSLVLENSLKEGWLGERKVCLLMVTVFSRWHLKIVPQTVGKIGLTKFIMYLYIYIFYMVCCMRLGIIDINLAWYWSKLSMYFCLQNWHMDNLKSVPCSCLSRWRNYCFFGFISHNKSTFDLLTLSERMNVDQLMDAGSELNLVLGQC